MKEGHIVKKQYIHIKNLFRVQNKRGRFAHTEGNDYICLVNEPRKRGDKFVPSFYSEPADNLVI